MEKKVRAKNGKGTKLFLRCNQISTICDPKQLGYLARIFIQRAKTNFQRLALCETGWVAAEKSTINEGVPQRKCLAFPWTQHPAQGQSVLTIGAGESQQPNRLKTHLKKAYDPLSSGERHSKSRESGSCCTTETIIKFWKKMKFWTQNCDGRKKILEHLSRIPTTSI